MITRQSKKLKEQEEELKQLQQVREGCLLFCTIILMLENQLQSVKSSWCVVYQVLDGKEELEKQHRESIKKLNSAVERQEKDTSRLQTDNEEVHEKNRSLQAALDASYK